MPRVNAEREKEKDAGRNARWADCGHCLKNVPRYARRSFHCGFLPESEWVGPEPLGKGLCDVEPSACAGYAISLPEVAEANRALSWRKDGALSEYLDGEPCSVALRDAMDILASAIGETQAEVSARMRREAEARRGNR